MVLKIEVRAVVNPLELVPPERKLVLDVVGVGGVVRQFVLSVLMPAHLLRPDPQALQPLEALGPPELEPFAFAARLHEELHFHLLELARAENEIARRDLVAKRLPDLRDAEGNLPARRLQD